MSKENNLLPDELLLAVTKPARYIGNEINMAVKNPGDAEVRFLFCFPDVYEVGMSHLGLQLLYFMINSRKDSYCERAFAPWEDMERILTEYGLPLTSLETAAPASDFDIVGFTLQYELSYSNIVNMLKLGGIEVFSLDRTDGAPIVCAGGPCAYNPEPLAEIIDFFYIGEAEATLNEIIELYAQNKSKGGSRIQFLESIVHVAGVYVPQFYDVTYSANGPIQSFIANHPLAPGTIIKAAVGDLDKAFRLSTMMAPLIETVHDRVALEVFRGCMRGCRFCQAGFVHRPVREREPSGLLAQAKELIACTGYEEISLVSLSTSDYSRFPELIGGLLSEFSDKRVSLSLPSLRIDAFALDLMEKLRRSGGRNASGSVTFAPEAGTQRMRDVINKNVTSEEIINGCKLAFSGGFSRVKLYYMIGLPTETDDDLRGIVKLSEDVVEAYYYEGKRPHPPAINVSTSCFVPKPFTPFQWEPQSSREDFIYKHDFVKKNIRKRQIKYSRHEAGQAVVECALARGDRRLARVIFRAHELGARFDAWTEHFRYDRWKQAFADCGLDLETYASRARGLDEILPWDHISAGVTKKFLLNERERAYKAATTPNCREKCTGCGACPQNFRSRV